MDTESVTRTSTVTASTLMLWFLLSAALFMLMARGAQAADDGKNLAQQITAAKSGTTVQLPAGTFDLGDITLPPGVSLKGAGYDKTILNAAAAQDGIRVRNSKDIAISDLTVKNARVTGIAISGSTGVRVLRARILNNSTGITLDGVTGGRVENCVIADNQVGVVCSKSQSTVLVNNTVANNDNLSLSLTGNQKCAVFNNLLTGSQTGVTADKSNTALALDYNLYVSLFVGGLIGELTRESLPAWRDLSGYDRHSMELNVEYSDAAAGTFRPTTPLPWAPARATSSDWGVPELAGFKAPEQDIDGKPRSGAVDLGAYEVQLKAPRPADGKFTVQSGEGVVSAGLFTKDGKNITYLFQNLPLRQGTYDFWLPKGVPAGQHELRLTESNLGLRYITLLGGSGKNTTADAPSIDPMLIIYDAQNQPILFQGGAEDHTMARSFDTQLQHARWRLTGSGGAVAATVDDAGNIYALQGNGSLYKFKADTGQGVPIADGSFRKNLPNIFSDKVAGMAFLGGNLYVADTGKNKLFYTAANEPTFARSFDVAAPRWPAADPERRLIWVISGEKLVALDPATGAVKHTATPVAKPEGLAIRNGRMAVNSSTTRRVHIFDCTDPANLKPLSVIGREWKPGDTGFGPIEADRLYSAGPVALDGAGNVATLDGNRVRLFTADGKALSTPLPFWGQQTPYGVLLGADGKPEIHFSGMHSPMTIALDQKNHTWRPGYRFSLPKPLPENLAGLFNEGGKNFAVYSDNNSDQGTFIILRFDNGIGKAVQGFKFDKEKNIMMAQTDSNGDGVIDATDEAKPLQTPDGKPVAGLRFLQDGRLIAGGTIIPRSVDAAGKITYDWSKYVPDKKVGALQAAGQGSFNGYFLPDGSWVTGGGKTRGFGGGFTTLEAVDTQGNPRWRHPLDYHFTTGAFRSLRVLPNMLLATATEELDTIFVDNDGLGLGVTGPIPGLDWEGYWHDQDWSLVAFMNENGKPNIVIGDYTRHGYHWMEVTGTESIKHSKVPVTVDDGRATLLASAPELTPVHMPKPPTPRVLIRKLAAPLAVDGDLKKWRALGIMPQIIISPPGIRPDDCSALVRAAWEGDNLYFQVIKFDDVVTMHQPLNYHYKQDSTEIALVGGFMGGYKFSITRTTDTGDILYREQFLMKKELNLDPQKAPRVIKVLDHAQDVEERSLLEKSYGVDLSKSKVIITEFKIPMSYAWDGKPPIEMKSGTTFWMGMFIDDNDTPGLDQQKAYSWPVTFQAFGNPDQGAQAVLE